MIIFFASRMFSHKLTDIALEDKSDLNDLQTRDAIRIIEFADRSSTHRQTVSRHKVMS